MSVSAGPFTGSAIFDIRSGEIVASTDIKGLVSSNSYDAFFRPTASYISTNAFGPPTLWQTRTYYILGGVSNGISANVVHSQINDASTVNGHDTYTYADGLGRSTEIRDAAENGQFRVANTAYDLRSKACFQTAPYFSSGSNYTFLSGTSLGVLKEYDAIGRMIRSTAAENGSFLSGVFVASAATGGDVGSPVGPITSSFVDGSNPWATIVTNAMGKTKKSYRDGYGRTIQVTDIDSSGNINTAYIYDLVGNLTNVTDNNNNSIVMTFDSLGRKISMSDPDMGFWRYSYDNAGRMVQQTDGRSNSIYFYYSDPIGRLSSKQIYNQANTLVGLINYSYDVSDDTNYIVYPGQLYKVTDLAGFQRSSYDVRGRILKTDRFVNVNAMDYVKQATYDDADRLQTLTYPGASVIIQYSYDTHLAISRR